MEVSRAGSEDAAWVCRDDSYLQAAWRTPPATGLCWHYLSFLGLQPCRFRTQAVPGAMDPCNALRCGDWSHSEAARWRRYEAEGGETSCFGFPKFGRSAIRVN